MWKTTWWRLPLKTYFTWPVIHLTVERWEGQKNTLRLSVLRPTLKYPVANYITYFTWGFLYCIFIIFTSSTNMTLGCYWVVETLSVILLFPISFVMFLFLSYATLLDNSWLVGDFINIWFSIIYAKSYIVNIDCLIISSRKKFWYIKFLCT